MTIHAMAAEPTTAGSIGITALLVALLGPLGGEYAAIVFAALAGALWPLLSTKAGETGQGGTPTSRRGGALFLAKIVFTAVVLTGSLTYLIEEHYSVPARHVTPVVAFLIGALGNGWGPVLEAFGSGLSSMVGRFLGGVADQKNGDQ
jgi:hypothetical protein